MAKKVRTLLKKLFINNWRRKCLSVILAIVIWFLVNKSLTMTKTIINVPIRIENIPPGKTVEGIQSNGLLNRRVNLILTGNKQLLEELNANDIQVVFDASGREGEWIATIGKKNIRSDNPDINLSQGISRITHQNFIIKLTKLVTEKIPIIITPPIGEAPHGYQFLDIWPYQLFITVSGSEDLVKSLKERGLKLTFNLNDISRTQLDELRSNNTKKHNDVVSFFIPNSWKLLSLPLLSSAPIEINDPDAKFLRIDFIRQELLQLSFPIPISLYFPPSLSKTINPTKVSLAPNSLIENRNGIKMIGENLYAKGVSAFFLDIVKNMVEIAVIVSPDDHNCLKYSIQFINVQDLENRYVRLLKSDSSDDEVRDLQPQVRENYLRNRFRNYMHHFQLYQTVDKPLNLCPKLEGGSITITEAPSHES
ncbi:MAG: hypothetical protein KDK76_04600 [Chlamydiia bacterium]|nr:hypothetical protein [Chlamydiia bacterium]